MLGYLESLIFSNFNLKYFKVCTILMCQVADYFFGFVITLSIHRVSLLLEAEQPCLVPQLPVTIVANS